jgi:hypothetical protein
MARVETRYGMAIAGLAAIAVVVLLAGRADAGFDGFDVDSSTFANKYNGNDIFNGTAFNNQWEMSGGGTELDFSLNGTNMVHTETTANGWIQHDDGTTPWELGSGSWTVEVNAKLNDTNPDLNDGFVVWTDLNGDNQIVWLQGDSINLLDGTELVGGIDNTDAFHTFRVAFDSSESTYHVFRDAVQVTPPAGIARRDGTANTRLLVGDCCTGIGNPIDQYEVAYIRYDMSGAFSPAPDQGEMALDIDRATGAMVINNTSGTNLGLLGYSLGSAAGAFDQSQWTTVADNHDVNGDGSVDDDDPWTVLTGSSGVTDLSEAELAGGDGGQIAARTGSVDLGTAWLRTPFEDVTFEVLTTDGTRLSSANGDLFVTYSGAETPVGDLAGGVDGGPDGVIDLNDWVVLKAGMNADVATLSPAQAYLHGDLDGDLVVGSRDFLRFVAAFDQANGQGAFGAMTHVVPEPTSCLLLLFGIGLVLSLIGCRKCPNGPGFFHPASGTMQRLFLFVLCCALSVVASADLASAQEFVFADYNADAGNPATAADIESPLDQGFLEWGATAQGQTHDPALIVQEGIVHNGVNAWRDSDDGPTNPGYLVDLTDDDLQAMFNFGWQYELVATLVRGGHFTAWGVGDTNPWDTGGRGRIGVSVGSSDTATTLTPVAGNGDPVDLGPDSLNGDFVRILLTGEPLTPNYTFEVFDFDSGAQIGTTQQLSGFGGSNALNDNRFGLQAGSSAGTGLELLFHSIRLQAFEPPRLTLEVNTSTGAASILNNAGESIALNGYFISSEAGALDPSGWLSLEDQDIGNPVDPTPGDKDNGDGWEEFDAIDSGYLAEGFLVDFTTLADQDSLSLGGAFVPSVLGLGNDGDLVFEFTDAMGRLIGGNVEYVTGGEILRGDVNRDTVVNGLDVDPFVDVLLNGPFQAEADMNTDGVVNGLDVDPFVAAVVGGGLHAVPEPSTLVLLSLAPLVGLAWRRR